MTQRKRGVWRGIAAGIMTKLAVAMILFLCVSFAVHTWPVRDIAINVAPERSFHPSTGAWLLLQVVNVVSGFVAGLACARWSPKKSWKVPTILISLALLATVFVPLPATDSRGRLALWVLSAPVGLGIGAYAYWRLYDRTDRGHAADLPSGMASSRLLRFLRATASIPNAIFLLIALVSLFPSLQYVFDRQYVELAIICVLTLVTLTFALRYRALVWIAVVVNVLATATFVAVACDTNTDPGTAIACAVLGAFTALNFVALATLRLKLARLVADQMKRSEKCPG